MFRFGFIIVFILFSSCVSESEESSLSLDYIQELSVVLYPIGNTSLMGVVKIFKKEDGIYFDYLISGLLPSLDFRMAIYENGDLLAADARDIGDILSVKKQDEIHYIGNITIFKSDKNGNFREVFRVKDTSYFKNYVGRTLAIHFLNHVENKELVIGAGVVGIREKKK